MTDPSAATPAGGSVIHDLGYRPYTGARVGPGAIARALTLTGFRNAFGLGRSGRSKVLPFILLVISIVGLAWLGGGHDFSGPSGSGSLAADVLSSLLGFLIWTCCTIVSARLFMKIGDRVKRSGPAASE